jgi:hypothetical protein
VYPHPDDTSAPVDFITIRSKEGYYEFTAVEVKTYPRQFAYERTGVDNPDFYSYKELAKTMRVVIFFVDAYEEAIYCLLFSDVYDRAIFDRTKVYFDLAECTKVRGLTDAELKRINWQPTPYYQGTKKFFQ